jgi:hypothetical protein
MAYDLTSTREGEPIPRDRQLQRILELIADDPRPPHTEIVVQVVTVLTAEELQPHLTVGYRAIRTIQIEGWNQ